MFKRPVVLWSCSIAHAVQDGLGAAVYVLLPILAQTLGLSYGQVGLFKGLKSLAQGLLEIASGIACERISERWLLIFGLGLASAGYLLVTFSNTAATVLTALIIMGIGAAFQHVPSSTLVSRTYASDGRRGALGLYNSSGDAGKLLFTAAFSLAIGAGLAWHIITLGFALIAALSALIVAVLLNSRAHNMQSDAAQRKIDAQDDRPTGWWIVDRSGFAALLAIVFVDIMVQTSVLVFIAFVMIAKGAPLYIGTLAAVCLLMGGICGKAVCGFVAERMGVRLTFVLTQLFTAAGIVAIVAAPLVVSYALLPLVGIVLLGSSSVTYGLVDDLVHPERSARGYALIYASGSIASVFGPYGFGLIGDWYDIETGMMAMAFVALFAIPPCLPLRVREPLVR